MQTETRDTGSVSTGGHSGPQDASNGSVFERLLLCRNSQSYLGHPYMEKKVNLRNQIFYSANTAKASPVPFSTQTRCPHQFKGGNVLTLGSRVCP